MIGKFREPSQEEELRVVKEILLLLLLIMTRGSQELLLALLRILCFYWKIQEVEVEKATKINKTKVVQ